MEFEDRKLRKTVTEISFLAWDKTI